MSSKTIIAFFIPLTLWSLVLHAQSALTPDPTTFGNLQSLYLTGGTVTQFFIYPQSDTVGKETTYRIEFVLSEDTLRSGATIQLYFPVGFILNQIDSVTYADNDDSNDEYDVESVSSQNGLLSVRLSESGQAPASGSKITLYAYGLRNATSIALYQLVLAIVSNDQELIAPPTWSGQFSLVADQLALLELFPQGIQQVHAGTTLRYYVQSSDQYGNTVNVQPIQWSVIGVPSPAGSIVDGDFQARFVGASRIVASYQNFADTSSLVYVLPGVFAYFDFAGGADTVTAGTAWRDSVNDVVVTAHDLFGNVDYEFAGEIYFQATDTIASLPYTVASRYHFVPADEGRHVFSGSSFKFYTAGRQDLSLLRDGVIQKTLRSISVVPGRVSSFNVSTPDSMTAGESFNVAIADAVDRWGNRVAGRVDCSLASGTGASPSGALPSLPSFLLNNGSGSGQLVLVKSGPDDLRFTLDATSASRRIIVAADSLARFDFKLDPVQVADKPFFGAAQLTALDKFDNVVTSYSAQSNAVVITSSGTGAMFNNVINTSGGFLSGICDLTKIGTGYSGTDPYVTFTATSQTGKRGVSPVVGFSVVKITGGRLAAEAKYVSEQYIFYLTISNFGSQPAIIDSIKLYGGGTRLSAITIDRPFPDAVAPLSNRIYTITGEVPDQPNQSIAFAAKFFGRIGTISVTDSVASLATLTILPTTGISTVAQSLTPQQVTIGREYSFSLKVRNDSESDLRLTTDTRLTIGAPENPLAQYALEAPTVLLAGGGISELRFVNGMIPSVSAGFINDISVRLVGTLGSLSYDTVLTVSPAVLAQSAPVLEYLQSTFAPTTLFRGREAAFSLTVVNAGTASLSVIPISTELSLFAADRLLITRLDATEFTIPNGTSKLSFKSLFIPADFPTAVDSITIDVKGTANDQTESFRLHLAGNIVQIFSGAAVQIVSTHNNARNVPYVNVGQAFSIDVTVRNQGDESLRDIAVKLQSDGSSTFLDSAVVSTLPASRDTTVTFEITASLTASVSELFSASIVRATGASSGLLAQVLPGLNSAQAVVIQTPANLSLVSGISAPPEAQDGVVGPGSSFTLTASVINNAQASVGEGELTLAILKGSFTTTDLPTKSFRIGEVINWTITPPAVGDTGLFEISISTIPDDNNNGVAANVANRTDTITVIVSEQQVALNVDFTSTPSPLLSAGGTYEVMTLEFEAVGESQNPYLSSLDFSIRDRSDHELDPGGILTAAALHYNGEYTVPGVVTDKRYRFSLGASSGVPRSGVISLTLRPDPSQNDFTLYLDSNSFVAEYQTLAGAKPVPVSARFASRLVIKKDFTLVPTALERSFFSYPNPFSPVSEQATIVYNLSAAKPATLKIYTLSGDEVITRNIPAQSAGQPVTIQWDGRNRDGEIVLNGVYIAVLTVEGLSEVRTKIAVVK